MSAQAKLVLASASPRRRDILSQLGVHFEVQPSAVEEPPHGGQAPADYARMLASAKAQNVAAQREQSGDGAFVLGADTIVVVDNAVLGKPQDTRDAARMVTVLGGRSHQVITAVALCRAGTSLHVTLGVQTLVEFRALDASQAEQYAASGEGLDKAGAYAIQGLGAGLVRAIKGSYTNVVGLPAVETVELLHNQGVLEAWP